MPTPTITPEDKKQSSKRDVAQQHSDRLANRLSNAEQRPGTTDMSDFEDKMDAPSADSAPSTADEYEKARQREADSASGVSGDWDDKTGQQEQRTPNRIWAWVKGKKKGIAGGVGAAGIIGIIFGGFSGFSMLTPSLLQNSVGKNDVRSALLDRRLVKAFEQKMSDSSGPCDTKLANCRAKKMPKVMLAAMADKGIVALNADGSKFTIDGNGYVDTNPHSYEISDGKGGTKTIPSGGFTSEYKSNPTFRKAFKGAYNMRYLGYNGAYMAKNFFKKLGLNKNGGMAADPELSEDNAREKINEKLSPSADSGSEGGAKSAFTKRIEQLLKRSADKTKKTGGDPILTVGTVACTAINMPRFIAGTYRAIQVAQVAILANELILSAGGMQQAGDAKAEAVAAIGLLLTEKVKNAGETSAKSALDSPILQSAIGVNKNKVAVSKYAPGYAMLSNPTVQATSKISDSTKGTCDLINSPQAAFAVAGVEGAISAASAGVGAVVIGALKGIGKLAIVFGAVDGIMKVAQDSGFIDWLGNTAYDVAKDYIGNYVEGARGVPLGDAAGVGILSTFSLAGSAGGASVLTMDQVPGFDEVVAGVDSEYRDEAVATLSPFDTSSSYTFLGSIVSNISLRASSSNPIENAMTAFSYAIKSPLGLLTNTAAAETTEAEASCGYAKDFGIDESIAINAAGYPCVGIPAQYLSMSRERAMQLVSDQIDVDTGEPLPDSDLATVLADCSDGDLETVTGCTIGGTSTAATGSTSFASAEVGTIANASLAATQTYTLCDEEGKNCETRTAEVGDSSTELRAAQSIYLFDQQVENILAGTDVEESEAAAPTPGTATGRPSNAVDVGSGWGLASGEDYSETPCDPRTDDAGIVTTVYGARIRTCVIKTQFSTVSAANGSNRVASVISTNAVNLFEAANAAGHNIGLADGMRLSFSGGYTSQHPSGVAMDIRVKSADDGGGFPTICFNQNDVVNGWGSLEGSEAACSAQGGVEYAAYKWLQANAGNYGFLNYVKEPWHWSTSGT